MRVLVVEDEQGIAQFVSQGLREAGFAVDMAQDGQAGLDFALVAEYDLFVLDILLPVIDGLSLLHRLRDRRIRTPVLLLTARDTVEDRVRGLDAGADDYLVKPFAFSELLARLRALLRRPPLQSDTILRVGDLEMDTARRQVHRAGQSIELSVKEFSLLEYFMRHPGQVLSRTQIAEHVWNFDFYNQSNVVDVYLGYLRRKVDRDFERPLLHTLRGVGYRLSAEVSHG
ncbi:response regulator transcription factor [Gloeobacter kilaueensis]|uniref:Two component transcriptional regulator, winged helix family n=1 Tax=Gloeobacter kilaueensis (strain ATCC BAA-2537 / CCAP 1431/1 / ULC 316 / JS1) TaxID=1183438 RepID=U5QKC7_GLOK1|nr:response regulator transcription factor [Gloeobacter kilaueensis]AGY58150.1 two component transcriptional regulator, winged helix family [Gloeobacter kilaueensis JS1]